MSAETRENADMPTTDTITVHGLPYLNATEDELRDLLADRLRHATGTAVFTPNATIAAACDRDADLFSLVRRADLLLPDGAGILEAAKRQKTPLCARLTGIDAAETVLRLVADASESFPVFFLGGKPGVAEKAAARWQDALPLLPVAGTHHGYFSPTGAENERLLQLIAASGAAVVLVCLGFPRQEQWILESRNRLPSVRLWMGLGGSFDVWSGERHRAPRPVRALRLEWLWRSLGTPSRLRDLPGMLRFVFGTQPSLPDRAGNNYR